MMDLFVKNKGYQIFDIYSICCFDSFDVLFAIKFIFLNNGKLNVIYLIVCNIKSLEGCRNLVLLIPLLFNDFNANFINQQRGRYDMEISRNQPVPDTSAEYLNEGPKTNEPLTESTPLKETIIHTTRRIIKNMNENQRFFKAKAHVIDALGYRYPRPLSQSLQTPLHFRRLYEVHTSAITQWLLFFCGYAFMYLVILDNQSYGVKIGVETTILVLFWADTIISRYLKSFESLSHHRKYSTFFLFRVTLLLLMTIDLIIFIAMPCYDCRPVRPFRILRCLIPMLYDPQKRKTFFSLVSTYKDIVVYIVFFSIIILGWALVGSRALTFDPAFVDPKFPQYVDPYKNNYSDLGHMIFVMYVVATYDSYPDNQILAIQNYPPNYIMFIIFIFMNMFLFSSIPGSLIYIKFRQTRSKIILMDEIRQQHSLIIAFVTLADESKNLSIDKLIKFLLYLYRYKIRYVEYVTDICLKLDENNHKQLQVNEFIQLSKIILENKAMTPPKYDDLEWWINFRGFMNQTLRLKFLVKHWIFELIVSIIIILSFINAIFFIYGYTPLVQTFDSIFIWIFVGELALRIIAIGPENFFPDRWNNVDTFLVIIGVTFFFVPVKNNADSIVRMSRIFRIASLLRLVSHSTFLENNKFQTFDKLKKLFSVILQIIPIILKFMPLFLVFFYIFAIFGMEVFYNSYTTTGNIAYNGYQQFSSFRNFIQSQLIMVQVLTEAGWSNIAFDHCWRNPQYYGYIMLYFCLMHITIVYILATLIKGMFWQVFFTVNNIFEERDKQTEIEEQKQKQNQKLAKQFRDINKAIELNKYISPNTVLKRQLYQNKLDKQIFHNLREKQRKIDKHYMQIAKKNTASKKQIVSRIMDNYNIEIDELDVGEQLKSKYTKELSEKGQSQISRKKLDFAIAKLSFGEIEQVAEQDFQSEIQVLFDHVILNPKARYSYIIGPNKLFLHFLKSKFVTPQSLISNETFDLHLHPLSSNKESMALHIYQVHALLKIETSKREQKAAIIKQLEQKKIINSQMVQKLTKKKLNEKVFNIDTNGTLRKLFLSDTNETLIKKFQIEYFSDLFGHSFKQINKLTLEPLLKVEATLTYSLRNILRYPQINNTQFFEMMTNIEDQISNKLLSRGSLFKFVYKLDAEQDIWFSIEYKHQQQMRVHFIKTGVWIQTNEFQNNQAYYARDIFKWDMEGKDAETGRKFLKRFYESFEGLAFSLLNEKKFFETNPQKYIYDLYVQCFDSEPISRYVKRQHEISKIMVVILSKQQNRRQIYEQELPYSLTDMKPIVQEEDEIEFFLQDTENETFEKLKNFAALDEEKIVENEGMPFSYVINLMREIADILNIYGSNFVFHIEKVLNDQYELMNKLNDGNKEKYPDENKEKYPEMESPLPLQIQQISLKMFD